MDKLGKKLDKVNKLSKRQAESCIPSPSPTEKLVKEVSERRRMPLNLLGQELGTATYQFQGVASQPETQPLEDIAELEHEKWVEWSKNIASREKLSPERLERWQKLWIPYCQLTETEKEQDRVWARKVMQAIAASQEAKCAECRKGGR